MNTLRRQIWEARSEYWYRKITTYPQVVEAARGESRALIAKFKNPGEMTYGDVATGLVCGVQVFGAFCLGEVIGRSNLAGYEVGKDHFNMVHHEGVM